MKRMPRLDDAALESLWEESIRGETVGSDVRVLIEDLRYYKALAEQRGKALEEIAESDDEWYVGRLPMREYARKALEDKP